MQEVGADELPLLHREFRMGRECLFHVTRASLEHLEQIPMAPLEVIEHFGELRGGGGRIECKDALDDVIGPGFVGRVEIARFRRRPELANHHSGGIRAQVHGLPMQQLRC